MTAQCDEYREIDGGTHLRHDHLQIRSREKRLNPVAASPKVAIAPISAKLKSAPSTDSAAPGTTLPDGVHSVAKAENNIPWLTLREVVARVARHLGCTPEDAKLRIVGKAEAGQIRACGVTVEGHMSLLPVSWREVDWNAGRCLRVRSRTSICASIT